MKIQVRPERLDEVAGQFAKAREESRHLIQSMQKSISLLESQWQGAVRESFYQRYHQSSRIMDQYIKKLHEVEKDLHHIANTFRKADDQKTVGHAKYTGEVKKKEQAKSWWQKGKDFLGEATGWYDVERAATGTDPVTGEELSTKERWIAGAWAVAGILPVGKLAKGGKIVAAGLKMGKGVVKARNFPNVKQVVVGTGMKIKQDVLEVKHFGKSVSNSAQNLFRAQWGMQPAFASSALDHYRNTKNTIENTVNKSSFSVEQKVQILHSVPSVKNGEFHKWFNDLTTDEFDTIWQDSNAKQAIKARLRYPGGMHEWHLVARADVFKYWGVTAEQITELRTAISEVKFVNPPGAHGRKGSTKAHNELLEIIDTSLDYNNFTRRLQNWAHYRFEGGVDALPEGLRLKK
ncbi:WXG100 family type VII secretion target [Ectobacillus panaciterrae]|uniref:WXG100 family type VII secretion target n=1 Tax=Ectobacillus panaciterrae TaxID=363872 RepID=UPI0004103A5F|nr:WXG100 family type VII secretion target [Ectobacillus panaciterrae]